MKGTQHKYFEKRIKSLLRVMLILLSAFIQSVAIAAIIADDSTSTSGKNVTDYSATVTAESGLNVRSGPGIDYPKISKLRYGSTVTVTHHYGSWSKIELGPSKSAYVSKKYLRRNNSTGTTSAPDSRPQAKDLNVTDYRAIVTASALNVRSGPGINHRIIGKRYRNSTVKVTHHNGIWLKLAWSQGSSAYVHGDYLRRQDTSGFEGVADPEGLLGHSSTPPVTNDDSTPPVTSNDECEKEQPLDSELLQTPYLAAAKEGVKMYDQPKTECPHYNNRFEKGENAKVLAERGNWAFISNEFNDQTGWVDKDSFLYAHRPAPESTSDNRIVNTVKELGCMVFSTVTALPPTKFTEFALSMTSNIACGSAFTTAREVQRTCLVEAGITVSGCPWVNQEPYKSNVDAWLALPNTRNGNTQAVDGRVLSVEDAYVNCLWAAANFGPDHWSLGWNHGGCVAENRQKP